jgi:hypothetical protein
LPTPIKSNNLSIMEEQMNKRWKGVLTFHLPEGPISFENTLTYGGVDHLVKSLAGVSSVALTHLYLRFGAALSVPVNEATAANFRQAGATGEAGVLYIPLYEPPTLTTSSQGVYTANELTFRYILSGADFRAEDKDAIRSIIYPDPTTSGQLFAAGVVSSQAFNDRTRDVVVAAMDISADTLSIDDATQVACTYKLTLTL